MQVVTVETPPSGVEADALAFGLVEGSELPAAVRELGDGIVAELEQLAADGEIRGRQREVTVLHAAGRTAASRVVAVGLGTRETLDDDSFRTAASNAARRVGGLGTRTLAWIVDQELAPAVNQARAVVDGSALGPFDHARWRSEPENDGAVSRLLLCGPGAAEAAEEAGVAGVVAAWTNRCRELVDAPPNEVTPDGLAAAAREVSAGFPGLALEELDAGGLEAAGLNLLTAVGRGSRVPPRLIVLRYSPESSADDLVLGLVGKAVTFDSGGLSLKPAASMEDMKSDMAGGAAVLAAMGAIAELDLPLRALAVVAACENMPGGNAYRPGDVLTGPNGKTVEITNTDAEGRLVLADALVHARSLGGTHLLDLATLTSGMVVAMGDFYAGLFANDDEWRNDVHEAGRASGDHVWPWPLHPSYDRYIESPFADMKNASLLRQGTPVYAARFLSKFAGEGPWAHVDMAGTGYLDRGRDDYYPELGATGFGVRLATELARRLAA